MKSSGLIFNIQDFSIHDGEGVRTVIFLKGCPLRCRWCSNPESQQHKIELMSDPLGKDKPKAVGRKTTAADLSAEISKRILFFKNAKGGVTLSGGEPLMQTDFVHALLGELDQFGISFSVETCGYFNWQKVISFASRFENIFFDVKTLNSVKHKKYTGKDNGLIISNLRELAEEYADKIVISVPIIPGFNDNIGDIKKIADFCLKIGIKKIVLHKYHCLGKDKYKRLGRRYNMPVVEVDETLLSQLRHFVIQKGMVYYG